MEEQAARIEPDDFFKVDVRVGTVVSAAPNPKARNPAYVLTIDFGELGTRTSSAQVTDLYTGAGLVGKQVVAVTNFAPKRIAGIKSEVLVLGATRPDGVVVLLEPDLSVPNGSRIS